MSNKKNALLHLLACVLLVILGVFSMKANIGMPIIYFVLAGLMLFLSLIYFSRKDDFQKTMLMKYLIVFFVSMVPLIELRGAIPIAVGMGLPKLTSFIIAIIANMLPVPIIYLFARGVLVWGKNKPYIGGFFTWCLQKGKKAGKKLKAKAGRGLYWALFLFVGIPLPGTGAWTGTLAASILKLDFKKTVIAVMCGVLFAGCIMMIASFGLFDVLLG